MKINITKYSPSDKSSIVKCMEKLQDYLVAFDQMKRTRRMPEYGECFTQKLLEEVDLIKKL